VSVHTNVAASPELRVSLWIQGTAPTATDVPSTEIPANWDARGVLGDLVAVPDGQRVGAAVHAVAVLARGVAPQTCLETPASPSCVVSRRTFEYQPNTRITVPLGLYRQCFGVTCGAEQTCNYEGRCVSERVSTGACGTESGCLIEGEPPVPPGVQEEPKVVPRPISDAPAPLAPTLAFRDEDPLQGFARGRLTLGAPMQPAIISGYRVYWVGAGGQRLGVAKEWPDSAAPKVWDLLPGTKVPAGAETFEAVAIDGARESAGVRVRADNYARSVDPELDFGTDGFIESYPFVATNKAGAQVLLVAGINSSQRLSVRRCAADGALCTRHDLGVPGRLGITFARAAVTLHDNKLYLAETSPDGALLLHICPEDMLSCLTRTLSPPGSHTDGYGTKIHIDADRGRVFVVSIEENSPEAPNASMVLQRCALDGTQCLRRTLGMGLAYDFGLSTDPQDGSVLMMVADHSANNRTLQLRRCASDGTGCTSTDADLALPGGDRCAVSLERVPNTRVVLATAQVGGCDQVSPSSGIIGVRCDLAAGTCTQHVVSNTSGDLAPHLVIDQAKARALMVITDQSNQGAASVLACDLGLLGCKKTLVGSGEWLSDLRLAPVTATGQVYLTGRTRARTTSTVLTRCSGDLSGCSYTDINDSTSKLSQTDNGYEPVISAGPGNKVAISTSAFSGDVSGHICMGEACSRGFRAPGIGAAVSYWPAQKTFVYAIHGEAGGATASLSVALCRENDSVCSMADVTLGHPLGSQRPIVVPDTAGTEFAIVHETTERGVLEPLITTCDAQAVNCSARFVFAGVPSRSHYGIDTKRGAKGALIISSLSAGRVVRTECLAPSQPCASTDIGAAPTAADEAYLGSAVIVRPGGTGMVVGTPSGASLITCPDGQPCGRVELPISSIAGDGPLWTSAVADDAHNAFYVALFRQGVRRYEFVGEESLGGNFEVYRCTHDGSTCERTISRRDIQFAFFYPEEQPADSLSWDGRPASLSLGSDGVLRVAVTDAANLFRPLIMELDSY
jgi:hypothetical protein